MKNQQIKIKDIPLQKKLLALLQHLIPLHSVYVIAMTTHRIKQASYLYPYGKTQHKQAVYTLLIVGQTTLKKQLDDVMEEVYNKMNQQCRVYIIYYSIANLMERIDTGDNFLTRTLKEVPCIYKKDDALTRYSQYGLMYHETIYKTIKSIWKHRMKRAIYMFSIIDVIHEDEEPLTKLAVLQKAMEQLCLGLLYVFWEFKPQYYHLSYLMHLCSTFTTLPNDLFPQTTFGVQRQYYMLCNIGEIINFKGTNEVNGFTLKDVDKVLKHCKQFLELANRIGEDHLTQLKEIHCKPETVLS